MRLKERLRLAKDLRAYLNCGGCSGQSPEAVGQKIFVDVSHTAQEQRKRRRDWQRVKRLSKAMCTVRQGEEADDRGSWSVECVLDVRRRPGCRIGCVFDALLVPWGMLSPDDVR